MPARVSPTERIRGEIDALFAEDRDLGEVLERPKLRGTDGSRPGCLASM